MKKSNIILLAIFLFACGTSYAGLTTTFEKLSDDVVVKIVRKEDGSIVSAKAITQSTIETMEKQKNIISSDINSANLKMREVVVDKKEEIVVDEFVYGKK